MDLPRLNAKPGLGYARRLRDVSFTYNLVTCCKNFKYEYTLSHTLQSIPRHLQILISILVTLQHNPTQPNNIKPPTRHHHPPRQLPSPPPPPLSHPPDRPNLPTHSRTPESTAWNFQILQVPRGAAPSRRLGLGSPRLGPQTFLAHGFPSPPCFRFIFVPSSKCSLSWWLCDAQSCMYLTLSLSRINAWLFPLTYGAARVGLEIHQQAPAHQPPKQAPPQLMQSKQPRVFSLLLCMQVINSTLKPTRPPVPVSPSRRM
ncbi:hypothetical protein GGI42DRAFT_294297 [Trichoderma sp. SZMC 28013]